MVENESSEKPGKRRRSAVSGISIIIPARNRFDSLVELIESIILQSNWLDCQVEVIVVDDESDDHFEFSKSTGQVTLKIVRIDSSKGANHARKQGFLHSTQDVVHFHDSDDLLAHNWLQVICDAFSRDDKVDLVVTPRIIDNADGKALSLCFDERVRAFEKRKKRLAILQKVVNILGPIGGVSFRRSLVETFSFHDVSASQDWLMYDEALAKVRRMKYVDSTYFIFRTSSSGRISKNTSRRLRGYVSAAKMRFKSRKVQKFMARFYCIYAKHDLEGRVDVKWSALKLRLIKILTSLLKYF